MISEEGHRVSYPPVMTVNAQENPRKNIRRPWGLELLYPQFSLKSRAKLMLFVSCIFLSKDSLPQ